MRLSTSSPISQPVNSDVSAPSQGSQVVPTVTDAVANTGSRPDENHARPRASSFPGAVKKRTPIENHLRLCYQNTRTDVTAGASPLIDDTLIRDVLAELKTLWPFTRSVSIDAISMEAYSRRRMNDLRQNGADYFGYLYGTRIARERSDLIGRRGLRVNEAISGAYQRDEQSKNYRKLCENFYHRRMKKKSNDAVFFVNGMHAVDQLKALRISNLTVKSYSKLADGLVAMEIERLSDTEEYGKLWLAVNRNLHILGLTPSLYQVIKIASQKNVDVRKRAKDPIDSSVILNDLCDGESSPVHLLRQTPESHHARAAALTVAALIDGLKTIQPSLDDNAIIANCLRAAQAVVKAMPMLLRDPERFRSGYSVLMDELHIMLAVAKPYTEADFKLAAKEMLADRAGAILQGMRIEEPETLLFSSGMNAIASAIEVARTLVGDENSVIGLVAGKYNHEYFEVIRLRELINDSLGSSSGEELNKANILLATLNSSTPTWSPATDDYKWNVESLVDKVSSVLNEKANAHESSSTILVLDTTIEKEGDLEHLLKTLKNSIEKGSLKIFLCKSYQKYINLLSAKIMAGGVTFIGAKDEETDATFSHLRKLEDELGWMNNEESQLLVHFMKCCHPMELSLLKQAAKNADFVRRICILPESAETGLVRWEEGIPLLLFANSDNFLLDFSFANGTKKTDPQDLQTTVESRIPFRDSFEFFESVHTGVVTTPGGKLDATRISLGQESYHELIEKFYVIGRLHRENSQFSLELALDKSTRAIDNASYKLIREENISLWGETALRILRRRAAESGVGVKADSTIAEGERLLELLHAPLLPPKEKARAGKGLADLLIPIMLSGYGEKSAILADKIRLLAAINKAGVATPAHPEGSVISVNAGLGKNVDHESDVALVEARFAINIVASYMNLAVAIIKHSSYDWREVMETDGPHQGMRDILKALAKSGMPGISPGVRVELLYPYILIISNELEKTPDNQSLIGDLITAVSVLSHPEDKANALLMIKEPVYKKMPLKTQEDIIREAFAPLDHASRLKVIEKLTNENAYAKLSSCFQFYDEEIDRVKSGKQEFFRPKDLLNVVDDGREIMSAVERSWQQWELVRSRMNAAIQKVTADTGR